MRGTLLPALVCLLLPVSAPAATLRPATVLEHPVVLVSDLFDDAGDAAGRALGPAPPPGGRIVVEAHQLAAIARQFGVDWRPAGEADRIVLDRPGRMLPREEVMTAVTDALARVGGPSDSVVELTGYTPPLVPQQSAAEAVIEQMDYDAGSGRFSAVLAVSAADMPIQRQRLAGRALESIEVPVATRRLVPGVAIGPGDLRTARLRAAPGSDGMVRDAGEALGRTPRRVVAAGQPLSRAELTLPPLVRKGARVTMLLDTPGLSLSAQGVALEAGAMGEHIAVSNPVSRAVVEGEIIAPDRVRVVPRPAAIAASTAQMRLAAERGF
jgi:flagellar basal body P-ring formation protein FlgA